MDKGTKRVLGIGAVAAAAVAFWYFFYGPGAAQTQATAAATSTSSAPQTPWFLPANAQEVAAISGWIASFSSANALNQQQWSTYMQTKATQQDIDVMAALITQYWSVNVAPPENLDNYFTSLSTAVQQNS